ncbi:uncharacterized protein [Spinacia oleracea]|uniref:DUF4283 domain-containing protein n=1 Tax=Spinacia oleracea TaxID=3562 RepID=A0A9R0IC34_SPIOL|nr:uncharacterized protein LOC110786196 [Spinacia oleracea]
MAGPHTFFGRKLIVKPWAANFNFQEEVLRVVHVWVRLPNLPLICWGSDSLSRIGSLLGAPLFADECTSKQLRISFVRILVEVDVTRELPKSVVVQVPVGKTIQQCVEYEWLPPFCNTCKVVGHTCSKEKNNTTIFKPATLHQKKVKKVWRPKTFNLNTCSVEITESEKGEIAKGVSDDFVAHLDLVVTPVVPIQDDGWRVVSRRNREVRTPVQTVGLAQVHIITDGVANDGGGTGMDSVIDQT